MLKKLYINLKSIIAQKKTMIGHSLIFVGLTVTKKGFGLILLPLITALISVSDYGRYVFLSSLIAPVSIILNLRLNTFISRIFTNDRVSGISKRKYLFSVISFVSIISLLAVIASVLLYHILGFQLDILISMIWFSLFAVLQVFYGLFISTKKPWPFLWTNLIAFVFQYGFGLVLLNYTELSYFGLLLGAIIGSLFALILSYIFLFTSKLVISNNSKVHFKRRVSLGISYSLPVIPYSLMRYASTVVDRWIVLGILGASSLGNYSIGLQLQAVLLMFVEAINNVARPAVMQKYSQNKASEVKKTVYLAFVILCLMSISLFFIGIYAIQMFLPSEYHIDPLVVSFLLVTSLFHFIYSMCSIGFFIGNTKKMPKASLAIFIFSTTVTFLSIYFYQAQISVAIASMGSMIFATLLVMFFNKSRLEHIHKTGIITTLLITIVILVLGGLGLK